MSKKPERSSASSGKAKPSILERLSAFEAVQVLEILLERHKHLVREAEEIAKATISEVIVENVAQEVYDAVMGIDLDDLNNRAGSHSWGYVEPSEAAGELLEEAIEDVITRMKRALELIRMEAAINSAAPNKTEIAREAED